MNYLKLAAQYQRITFERRRIAIRVQTGRVFEEKTCEANPAGENISLIFTVCIKSVPLYYFKLVYVVLHMVVMIKEFFGTHF